MKIRYWSVLDNLVTDTSAIYATVERLRFIDVSS